MARLIPQLDETRLRELDSAAEAKLYRALRDQLPEDFLVLFQVTWILRRKKENARDGELDFLICHPQLGFLCIEVKGGGIEFNASSGEWFSIDRHSAKHVIKDPIRQALRAKYSIQTKLNEHPGWREFRNKKILAGHAVFLPDVADTTKLSRPDMPHTLIGNSNQLDQIASWVTDAFDMWRNKSDSFEALGHRGIDLIQKTFARSFTARPLVSNKLAEQEKIRLELTSNQSRLLGFLGARRRVSIRGGAGTGKTVLAVEKARSLAQEGFKTLLTCYNRQLADHLASICEPVSNLDVMSFHQLCARRIKLAELASGRDLLEEAKYTYPGMDFFNVQYPNALAYSLDVIEDRYDAIVCDEGQDFREDYWVPLELLLADLDESPLYIFFDDNQDIYKCASTFPIADTPFPLDSNCRNTSQIHTAAYIYYKGDPVCPSGNQGEEIRCITAANLQKQSEAICTYVTDLIVRENVEPNDITVLIGDSAQKKTYYSILSKRPLPNPVRWSEEQKLAGKHLLMDTVSRFKGLESDIVVLWGLDSINLSKDSELLYVGMTRAKSVLAIVGSAEFCSKVLGCAPLAETV